jgi:hypothetical protein
VVVTAAITNGTAVGTDYTKNFTITVSVKVSQPEGGIGNIPSTALETSGVTNDAAELNVLKALGINKVAQRLDPNGNVLRDNFEPLGVKGSRAAVPDGTSTRSMRALAAGSDGSGAKTTLSRINEIYVDGKIYDDGGNNYGLLGTTPTTPPVGPSVSGDFDDDGFDEVIIIGENSIYYVDFNDGAFTSKTEVVRNSGYSDVKDVVAGDFDGDGLYEVIVAAGNNIYFLDDYDHNFAEISSMDIPRYFYAGGINASNSTNYVSLAVADFDQNGIDDWALATGEMGPPRAIKGSGIVRTYQGAYDYQYSDYDNYYTESDGQVTVIIYNDWTSGSKTSELYSYHQSTGDRMMFANMKAGDFDGDGLPDLALYGPASNTKEQPVVVKEESFSETGSSYNFYPNWDNNAGEQGIHRYKGNDADLLSLTIRTTMNSLSYPVFTPGNPEVQGGTMTTATFDSYWDRVVRTGQDPNRYNKWAAYEGKLKSVSRPNDIAVLALAVGDTTGDGMANIICGTGDKWRTAVGNVNRDMKAEKIETVANGSTFDLKIDGVTKVSGLSSPYFSLLNVDYDSLIVEYRGHELVFTDPIILTVLASPPYYEGSTNESGGTSYGVSIGSGSGATKSAGFGVAIYIGTEFDSGIGGGTGWDIELAIENSFTWGASDSLEITESYGYSVGVGEDMVIYTAIPVDVYYYRTITYPDWDISAKSGSASDVEDKIITVVVPRKPGYYSADIDYYNSHNGDAWDVVLNHTLGVPSSYYRESDIPNLKTQSLIAVYGTSSSLITLPFAGLFTTTNTMTVPRGNTTSAFLSLERVGTSEKTFNWDMSVSLDVKVKAGGIKAGGGLETHTGIETSTSISTGMAIEGSVPGISTNMPDDLDLFRWGLMMFPVSNVLLDPANATGKELQKFNLVTYWVQPNM